MWHAEELAFVWHSAQQEEGTHWHLRYSLLALTCGPARCFALAAVAWRVGSAGELAGAALAPAGEEEAEAWRVFRRLASATSPVFPVHLQDVVEDLLRPGGVRAALRQAAG